MNVGRIVRFQYHPACEGHDGRVEFPLVEGSGRVISEGDEFYALLVGGSIQFVPTHNIFTRWRDSGAGDVGAAEIRRMGMGP